MILEISCEVRERGSRNPRRETFTTAAQSMEEVDRLIAARFPGKWCVHPEARVIDVDSVVENLPATAFNRTADGIAVLESHGVDLYEVERQAQALKRKPGRPPKHG